MVKTTNQPKITWHFNDMCQDPITCDEFFMAIPDVDSYCNRTGITQSLCLNGLVTIQYHPPFKVYHATFGYIVG